MTTGSQRSAPPPRGIQQRVERRFFSKPPTPIVAASFIAGVSLSVSIVAGIVAHWIDDSIGSVWLGIYWAAQTVTTVGYGDELPRGTTGQALSVVLMLIGTAFIGVVTAAVTTVFIEQARALRAHEDDEAEAQERATLEEIRERLARIEARLDASSGG